MIIYAVMTVIIITVQVYCYWLNSKGIIPYKLNIVVALSHAISNFVMVAHDSETWSILLWTPLEVWIILMMIKGLLREKEKQMSNRRKSTE